MASSFLAMTASGVMYVKSKHHNLPPGQIPGKRFRGYQKPCPSAELLAIARRQEQNSIYPGEYLEDLVSTAY